MNMTKLTAAAFAFAMTVGLTNGIAEAADGKKVFKKCKACHSMGLNHKLGPGLKGVVGRKCGTATNKKGKVYKYGKGYKAACAAAPFVLDEAFLREYLANPSKKLSAITGKKTKSKMVFKLKKEDQRKAVIAYLKGN